MNRNRLTPPPLSSRYPPYSTQVVDKDLMDMLVMELKRRAGGAQRVQDG
jgi:hypothetical protein